MTTDTIKISQEINFNGLPTWVSVGGTLIEGENVLDGLRQLQKSITDYHAEEAKKYQSHNWAKSEPPYPDKQVDKPTDKIQGWIQVIELTDNLNSLGRFKNSVDNVNDPKLNEAYNKQLEKLTNKK